MRFFLIFVSFFILVGCSSRPDTISFFAHSENQKNIAYVDSVKFDVFWDLGLLRITGVNVRTYKGMTDSVEQALVQDHFCYITNFQNLGSRIYSASSEKAGLNIECLYEISFPDKIAMENLSYAFRQVTRNPVSHYLDENKLKEQRYSVTIKNDFDDGKGYELLRIDSSKLPLESLRYKELKKREGL